MKVFALDGHPGQDGFAKELYAEYIEGAEGADIETMALREMVFDPVLHEGYRKRQDWEPDLERAAEALRACDHFLVAFPMWWGSQPALLKGFFDRVLLPGVAFKYREKGPFWDRLLAGKSATALITGDTPGYFLRWRHSDPIRHQVRGQVFDFCGFKPARVHYFGPIRRQSERKLDQWRAKARQLGQTETSGKA